MRSGITILALTACLSVVGPAANLRKSQAAQPPISVASSKPPGRLDLPEGFCEEVLATGITGAVAMTIAPDGRVLICEQTGALRVVKDDTLLPAPMVTVKVDSSWERGLIGVTLDPAFPQRPYVYLCYVAPEPYPHHRISRFTVAGDAADPKSEVVLLEGDDQRKFGGSKPDGHQGGAIHFGRDGKLYIGIGDQTAGLPAQRLDALQGKLMRINSDGSIPDDNPFFKISAGKFRAVWAYGLRNPFAFAVQPGTGRILIDDVGEASWEEIDEGVAGANYGWPQAEGPSADPRFKGPLYAYDHSQGRSITGGAFYNPSHVQFPPEYVGRFFFADFMDNWIRTLDPDHPTDVRPFAAGLNGAVDVQVGPEGSLYVLNRNSWVKDDKFKPGTGSLHRISYVANSGKPFPLITSQPEEVTAGVGREATFGVAAKGQAPLSYQWFRNGQALAKADGPTLTIKVAPNDDGAEFRCQVSNRLGTANSHAAALWTAPLPKLLAGLRVGPNPGDLPKLLSQTGLFTSLEDLTPAEGVLPYDVNSPLWSDGASKRRWLVLPPGAPIGLSENGAWRFPAGTVFVKHFELATVEGQPPRRLETRLLVVDRRGRGYGVTYRWRPDASDAELLTEGMTEEIDLGGRKQTWTYPSRNDCLVCHTANAGFVLGVNTRQLNHSAHDPAAKQGGNLLQAWNRRGLFQPAIRDDDFHKLDRLAAISDSTAPLESRVRSYLDSNCAQCHRPGGARAEFDARFETPLNRQKLINSPVMASNMGIGGAKLVKPGDPDRSLLLQRMKRRQDVYNMPPLASHLADAAAVAAMTAWIQNLAAPAKEPSGAAAAPPAGIRVSDVTLFGDLDCFKIETPTATYVYGKKGAGFASVLDKDGRDWVSYHPADKSKGEYHGLPKCGQPTKFFHCGYGYGMYKTDRPFSSRTTTQAADHVRIESATADNKSACSWDFYLDHATLTLLHIDLPTYWFLYEGTPGGKLHPSTDFVIRPDGTRTTLDQPWVAKVPWVCFGTAASPIGLVCLNHQPPEPGEDDSYVYWPYQKEADGSFQDMTVFGFGRRGYQDLLQHTPELKRLPARFSIGFVPQADYETAKAACEKLRRSPGDPLNP